ncbi:cyclic GMP-AMP synthase-like [Anoplophora glabripennis]|uniref:cyclic GMP-AMP synthase-like n=1 Tax=Anoplophora glabripennis TaxID=217634 RepID=UPI000874CDEC|nr:cyclic GMP-AMP synthase-like [Anoplophora glabripennis]
MEDRRRYRGMDEHLENINREYISFPKSVVRRNNRILSEVLNPLICRMRQTDQLFDQLYKKNFYGGSYYDGLKVGSPDEYDIDLLLKFPPTCGIEIRIGEIPGFVNMYMHNNTGFEKLCSTDDKWKSFLDTRKVLEWMEGIVQKGLNYFRPDNNSWCTFGSEESLYVKKFRKSGPAFTLIIIGELDGEEVKMDVDIVTCFEFGQDKWPKDGFKVYSDKYGFNLSEFFVVPKKPKGTPENDTKYWRLSFQIQERDFINNKGHLKPALRLLKKMRDTMQHKQVSSYYLKTVVLWKVLDCDSSFFSDNSLSYVFMHILKQYQACLSREEILYFWNDNYNFLDLVSGDVANMSNRIRRIINDIEGNMPDNPEVIVKYILTPDERKTLYPEPNPEPRITYE